MAGVTLKEIMTGKSGAKAADTIQERLSQELIIALVGPVASGVSTAAQYIKDILIQDFSYSVGEIIKPSNIIKTEAYRVQKPISDGLSMSDYVQQMQDAGNLLRETFGNNYLSEKVVERICKFRVESGGFVDDVHIPGRRAYIVDSIKNPEELELLRQIYGETLCVIGVFAPDELRRARLSDLFVPEDQIAKILDRDQNEPATFGQKTRKLFVLADFFVRNDQRKEELRRKIDRFINIVFDTAIHTPARAESAMYEASSAAANSACMSRQVGAAIVSSTGELISVGWNDVPRFGGGLYTEDHQTSFDAERRQVIDRDNRCFKWGGCICHNEVRKQGILHKITQRIASSDLAKEGTTAEDIKRLLAGTDVDSLIEFSRSIHAEMEAILAVAREGRHSLIGATLYTNTYPCHNCARHIVASGIKNVIYIEPYLKSLATDLHRDAITENVSETDKVVFSQYDGVAPRNYLKFFRPTAERKVSGRLSRPPRNSAVPVFRVQLDSQAVYEDRVIAELSEKEQPVRPSLVASREVDL